MTTSPTDSAEGGAVENVVFPVVKLLFIVGKKLFFVYTNGGRWSYVIICHNMIGNGSLNIVLAFSNVSRT